MHENDQSKADDENPVRLTIYKPEGQVFQKLHLCEYLRELYEAAKNENEHGGREKERFRIPHTKEV